MQKITTLADKMLRELTETELNKVSGGSQSDQLDDGDCRTVCYITIGSVTTKHCDPVGDG